MDIKLPPSNPRPSSPDTASGLLRPGQVRDSAIRLIDERRNRWKARSAARKSLFSRPTPLASRLLLLASVRQWMARVSLLLNLLLLLHFVWILGGLGADLALLRHLDRLLQPLLVPFEGLLPPIQVSPSQRLELSHLLLMGLVLGVSQGLSRLISRQLWGKGVEPMPFPPA